ncbi:MAG: hypothetical protein QXK76_03620 [Candidatus Woesearchaeota archaeon]
MNKNIKTLVLNMVFLLIYTIPFIHSENITDNIQNQNIENYNIELILPKTYKETTPGTDVWFTIKILNLGNTKRIDIVLISELLDDKKNIVVSKKKTVAMETQSSFVNEIQLPTNLKPGKYSIRTKIEGTNLEAEQEFYIKNEKNITYLIIFLILILIIGTLIYIKRNIEHWILKFKIKKIINNRIKSEIKK